MRQGKSRCMKCQTTIDQNTGECDCTPSPASDGYRLLSDGDIIQIGDEFIDDDAETWIPVGRNTSVAEIWMVGMTYFLGGALKPMRRKRSER